jgi:hypothetical protein
MTGGSGRSRAVGGIVIAAIAIGVGLFYIYHRHNEDEVVAGSVAGGPPQVSGPLAGVGEMPAPPPPYQGPPIAGFVRTPGGQPVAGAHVSLSTDRNFVRLGLGGDHPTDVGGNSGTTAADGRFEIAPSAAPRGILVRCQEGFAFAAASALASNQNLIVQPWGRVEGTASFGRQPAARARLILEFDRQLAAAGIYLDGRVQTDDAGHFVIEYVPPRKLAIGVLPPAARLIPRLAEVNVTSGATAAVRLGGDGRPLVGRVTPSVQAMNYRRVIVQSHQSMPQHDRITAEINPDGTFRIDDVTAGTYALSIECGASDERSLDIVATAASTITIPPVPSANGYSDELFDLGTIPLKLKAGYALGEPAPNLSGADVDGKAVKLSDFAGKYVLFSFAQDVSGRAWSEMFRLRAIHDRFGGNPKFVMLLFYSGSSFDQATQAASKAGMQWRLVHLDSGLKDLPETYRAAAHPTFLIDPQGKLAAPNLDPMRAFSVVDHILTAHDSAPSDNLIIRVDHLTPDQASTSAPYKTVPPPSADDAATTANISVVDGTLPAGPDPVHCLNDGQMPTSQDERDQNFRFAMGTLEGRVRFDLGHVVPISEINSYSWHSDTRAPQLYRVFGSNGDAASFDLAPKIGIDPASCGWTIIADVDTRPQSGPVGGRYAVNLSNSSGLLGSYRYLLFVMFATETDDDSGHTFYSEIDVIQRK